LQLRIENMELKVAPDSDADIKTLASILLDLSDKTADGKPVTDAQRIDAMRKLVSSGRLPSFVPLLPLVLNLNGKPYTLRDHFPLEPVFRVRLTRQLLLKTARQIAKSTSWAARGLILCNAIPHFSILFVTPLYEQIRRFSTNYVRPFIEQSPLHSLWIGTGTENSVLQRSFKNCSKMYFSFALADANRVRGISAHANSFDEIQDMDGSLIPIIQETMSASTWRLSMYAGTPKTLDNPIEGRWLSSSQAEWCIPCFNCKHLNVPKMGYDLEKMIGPWHDNIGVLNPTPEQIKNGVKVGVPGTVCARCRKWIDPRQGRWIHRFPERRWKFPGYHIPQIIMPMHYSDPDRWSELLAKREGYGNCTVPQFYNEILGESFDTGTKLLTKTDLEQASILPWANDPISPTEPVKRKNEYVMRVLGVDWGGGGEEEISFTVMAVLGLRPDGRLDVIYGRRLLTPHDPLAEAHQILRIYNIFSCNILAHDYNGAGSLRETFCVQAGLPLQNIAPIVYTRSANKNIITYHKSEQQHSRDYWLLDKARALQLVCQCIRLKWIRLFKHDYVSEENRGLQHDFLSLTENKVEMPRGPDVYMIQRNPHFPDDFAHAVTYAACAIWHRTQQWPNIANLAGLQLTLDQLNQISPDRPWQDYSGPFPTGR
jgi:hypothetical protein